MVNPFNWSMVLGKEQQSTNRQSFNIMDADQKEVIQYLKSWPGQFVSRKEICRRAGGKWRFRQDENWALPSLQRLEEDGVIEQDDTGHYRLLKRGIQSTKMHQKVWMSPAIKQILQRNSRKLVVVDLDQELTEEEREGKSGQSICYLVDDPIRPGHAVKA